MLKRVSALAVVVVALAAGLALWPRPAAALPNPQTSAVAAYLGARPASEHLLFLKMNGSPSKLGVIVSGAGASTTNASTAAPFTISSGDTCMVICDAAANCIEGATASTAIANAAFGIPQGVNIPRIWVFKFTSLTTTTTTFACAGPGAFNCAVFTML